MDSALRIVLVGKTGSGKSATGNTILGEEVFHAESSAASVTRECKSVSRQRFGRYISVIDTPGIFDTDMDNYQLNKEIDNCMVFSLPGPHAFLLVMRLGARMTKEELNAVKWIEDNFGEDAFKYTNILFTCEDQLDIPVFRYINSNTALKELVAMCETEHVVFNNKIDDVSQVEKLLEKIDEMVEWNKGIHTSEMFQEAQSRKWYKEKKKLVITSVPTLAVAAAAVAAGPAAGRLVGATKEVSAVPVAMALSAAGGAAATVVSSAARSMLGWIWRQRQ